jgi:hypothetical protein
MNRIAMPDPRNLLWRGFNFTGESILCLGDTLPFVA